MTSFSASLAPPAPALTIIPTPIPSILAYPDLVVHDIDVNFHEGSGALSVDLDVKNKGNAPFSGVLRLDAYVKTDDGRTYHLTKNLYVTIAAGQKARDLVLPSVTPRNFSQTLSVVGVVDQASSYATPWEAKGAWWEWNEYNNWKTETFVYDSSTKDYVEP